MRDLIKITLGDGTMISGLILEEAEVNLAALQTQQDAFSPPEPELPVDIVSSIEQSTFVQGNHALRSNWQNSFWVPPMANRNYLSPYPWVAVHWVRPNSIESRHHEKSDQLAGHGHRYRDSAVVRDR
jgi:hypothetical protein